MPVSYWINEKGLSQIGNGSEFAAIHASFHTWENVASADVGFVYKGTTTVTGANHDGMNVISFSDTTVPLGSSTIAATFSFFKSEVGSDDRIHRVFDEADIVFNPALDFSTSAEDSKFDIQSVLTHEIGHLLGLDHSGLVSSVMVPFGAPSQLDQRMLTYDDIAGITEIYPRASATAGFGQIRGTIRSGTAGILGAHVVALTTAGTTLVSTLSQPDGSYLLRSLPSGSYKVFAEPLDSPVTKSNIGGSFYANGRTDFGTTYFGNVSTQSEARTITVTAGGTATANIDTLPKSATGLNLTRPAFGVRMARGVSGTLTIGGEDITSGVVFTASTTVISLGAPTFGGRISSAASTSARIGVSVASSAAPGAINLAVNRGADASVLAGALVITDTPPRNISIAPASGPVDGGTPVTVTGTNFRSGAQVYFGGIAAVGMSVVDSGTILANVPENSSGPVNVVVVNSDGTWGAAPRAFTYDALPPVITRITPSSGPATTSVIIEGQNFDSQSRNVSVQFNGVEARVVSATPSAITTIVPFGVISGPITLSVFGKSVLGPVFTVTSPALSTNIPTPVFKFIDASVDTGGTNLTFSNNDDSVAVATLPFKFSLFRDIYLPGSPLSITTNGFLSFENISSAEFQNGPLPGQSVARPSGTTGVIPPALVAPFWDDLALKAGSAVTTRIIGDAPNRQFVVQWSNLSILDEEGTDLNASLTFEVVLFEGSNDIQFLYRSMEGPRSDGSSATIGAQDLKRTVAIQSGFNQPIVSSGYFKIYHFDNGGYSELAPDLTPPSKPVITDEGTLTANRTQLAVSWISDDAESGIREYQYAIGTTAGGTELKPFASTTHNSIVVTGLNLQSGVNYYFAVKAINGAGLESETGVSDGIRYDPAYQPQVKIIPSAPHGSSEFTGLALLAPTAMTVVLRAYDSTGAIILGSGIRNPTTISLAAGQQSIKLVSEIFGIQNFDGWVEAEASGPGLGIFTATGAWDRSTLDSSVVRDTSADFVLFHAGASAIIVNPSSRAANVTMTALSTNANQSFTIPARGRFVTTLTGAVRIRSSEPLGVIERLGSPGKLAINAAVPVTDAQTALVFPHAVAGGGYVSTLTLANVSGTAQTVTVAFGTSTATVQVPPNGSTRIQVATLLKTVVFNAGAVTVNTSGLSGPPAIVGVLDIENEKGMVTVGARPAATEVTLPYVANGNGMFTGLAVAAGSSAANVTVEVYEPSGTAVKSATVSVGANQQIGRLLSEVVPAAAAQVGGYIRLRSDQPIWAWEIYGSGEMMASGPPL